MNCHIMNLYIVLQRYPLKLVCQPASHDASWSKDPMLVEAYKSKQFPSVSSSQSGPLVAQQAGPIQNCNIVILFFRQTLNLILVQSSFAGGVHTPLVLRAHSLDHKSQNQPKRANKVTAATAELVVNYEAPSLQ